MGHDHEDDLFAAIDSAPRALVFLSVPWSSPERVARADFRAAARRLEGLGLSVEAFVLDEEAESVQRWLAALGLPEPYGRGIPLGWGGVLWLESGKLAGFVGRGIDARAVGIIGRSRALWGMGGRPAPRREAGGAAKGVSTRRPTASRSRR